MQASLVLDIKPEELAGLTESEVPTFYASSFRIQGTGTGFAIFAERPAPLEDKDGSIHPGVAKKKAEALIYMSPQTLKDLSILLAKQIEVYEEEFGEINTPYMK